MKLLIILLVIASLNIQAQDEFPDKQKIEIYQRITEVNDDIAGFLSYPVPIAIKRAFFAKADAYYDYEDYLYGDAIWIGDIFISKGSSVVLPILTHEYGHVIFEHNVLAPLIAKFPKKEDDLRRSSIPINELFADIVAHLYEENLSIQKVSRVAFEDIDPNMDLTETERKQISKRAKTNSIAACRDYKGKHSKLAPFYLMHRKKHLNVHFSLCPSASYIWNKISHAEYDRGETLVELTKIFSSYLESLLIKGRATNVLLQNKRRMNKKLISFFSINFRPSHSQP